jgi:DNA-binding CsgD family transcriptional regulator
VTPAYRDVMGTEPDRRPAPAQWDVTLASAAADLYDDLRLPPLLRRLLAHSGRLLDAVAATVSLVDPSRTRYAKIAERGVSCRLGATFPLDEGATGCVVAARRPVVLAHYRDVRGGHLPPAHPASTGAVVAVPIWWRGDVIGANVVFAGRSRRFTTAEVDGLEVLTQVAAAGIVTAGADDPALSHLRTGGRGVPVPGGSPLTPREQEVLALLGRGLSDREVAAALVISPKTVEKHVGAVLRKTGTPGRTAAVVRALERGWLA